jgi:hypothetical protein
VVGISFSPMLRYQQGFPYGRTFAATLAYGSVRFLAEPFGTRRQDDIIITDLRIEKSVNFASRRDVSVFFDLYNMFNQNPEQNLQWSSGTAFNRPLSIVPAAAGADRREGQLLRSLVPSLLESAD